MGYIEVNHSSEAEDMLKDYYIGELDVRHPVPPTPIFSVADLVSLFSGSFIGLL